jgi:hypothetical protein
MDEVFNRFADRRPDDGWLSIMESFGEALQRRGATGIYGDGSPFTENTYNGENLLSQVLQYLYFEFGGESHVLLQIHGGCDVRGGYTKPRAFTLNSELSIMFAADAVLYPELPSIERVQQKLPGMESAPEPPTWSTDDGYHFRSEGYRQSYLESFPASDDPETRGKGIIYIDDDHNLYCPLSGYRLAPSFY